MIKVSDQETASAAAAGPPNGDEPDVELRILEAARRVFTRHGTAGARMQQIATEAGVNQALIHYYFRSKEQLADRIFSEAVAKLVGGLAPALAEEESVEALVTGFVHGYIDAIRDTPFLPAYVLSETYHHPERLQTMVERAMGTELSAVGGRVLERVTKLVEAGVAAGTIRPMPPRQLLVNVLALVVFPFAGRPVLMPLFGIDEAGFDAFILERRAALPALILNAIRP